MQQALDAIKQNSAFDSTVSGRKRMEVTYLTTEVPYPISHGGIMATHGVIQAIAKSASLSIVVLTHRHYTDAAIGAAKDYYSRTCKSFVCHQFKSLSPSTSNFVKAWHYLVGYPRHGFWNKDADQILAEQIRKTGCQILWCGSTYEAKYLRTAKQMKCRTVLTNQNVESDLGYQQMQEDAGFARLVSWVRWWDLRRLENMGARWADVVTGITSVDIEHFRRIKSHDCVFLLPFGYPPGDAVHAGNGDREEANTVCFIGSMNWPPNIKAAQHLVRDVMPLVQEAIPAAKCLLVGKDPPEEVLKLSSSNVTVTGGVPSVSSYYEKATLIVVPIQGVSGVKIKLIEAMAAGKAIVTTSAGAAGLKVEHGKHLMIADDPNKFSTAVIELLRSKSERDRLGDHARRFVAEHLSPKETERQVEKILERLKQS